MSDDSKRPQWAEILKRAVSEPGTINAAYSAFHRYSLGNALWAMEQCAERKIPLGPIASFNGWKKLGRHVKRGEKAIVL
jgi:N-terminal domain of anti-restriction factor ArdC